MKVLFYLQDFHKLDDYKKSIKTLSCSVNEEFINDKETFLKKFKKKSCDLAFLRLFDNIDDILFFKKVCDINNGVPIIVILDELDVANRLLKNSLNKDLIEIMVEYDFLHTALTSVNFRVINENRMIGKPRELIKIIEKGQKFWLTVFDNLPELVMILDENGFIVRCNKTLSNLFQKHPREIVGNRAKDIIPFNFIKNLDQKELPSFIEEDFNGRCYYITITKIVFEGENKFLFFFKDMTEYKKMKEHIYLKEKYTSIGTLASGIAHEINNPLTGIIGFTQMLKMTAGCKDNSEILDKILECAERCKNIVESLLVYARQKPASRSLELVNNIIERTINLVGYNLKKHNIKIVTELGNVPVLLLDGQQIQQVLINIILNAQDAILKAQRKQGEIKIKTLFIERENKIFIRISDNGIGIPDNILPRIFDPFFTTKPFGEAMGLGLSIAYGIVKEHNGNILVESIENVGTTFVIELPVK